MKKKLLILIISVTILLTGCLVYLLLRDSKETKIDYILIKDIFKQEDNDYLVLFANNSELSKDVIECIENYSKNSSSDKKQYNIYIVTINELSEKEQINNVTKYEDIYISSVPTLVKVKTNNKKSLEVLSKNEDIKDYFYGLTNKYKIKYLLNGGTFESTYFKSFNEPSDVTLFAPKKEGYTFAGFYEDGNLVTSLSSKDYTLEAKWIDKIDYDYILDEEIFNQPEDNYLVYFMKDGCNYCTKVKENVLSYMYLSGETGLKIYIVNLNNGVKSSILRSYTGEDGQGDDKDIYADNVTKWDDLYIPSTPTLIKISKVGNTRISKFLCVGSTNIASTLSKALNNNYNEVIVDLGEGVNETYRFYDFETFTTPILVKDGYQFICFEEDGIIVTDFEYRNYFVKAIWSKIDQLDEKDIFNMPNNKYLIYFTSSLSNEIDSEILLYIYKRSKEIYKLSRPLYIVSLKSEDYESSIFNKEGVTDVNNKDNINQLKVGSLPLLMEVNDKESYLSASTYEEVLEALDSYTVVNGDEKNTSLCEIKFETNNVIYNGELTSSIPSIFVYPWQEVKSFPKLSKEGFIFLGYTLDGELITTLKGQNVTLKLLWINKSYYEEINDTEIFNQKENRYLVYFMKDGCTYCDKTKSYIYEYVEKASTEYKNSPKIYVVNLKKDGVKSVILRTYGGNDSGTFVDGVKQYDDLYIPSTPTIIEISGDDVTSKLLGVGTSSVIKALENNLTKSNKEIGEKQKYDIQIDLGFDNEKYILSFYNKDDINIPTFTQEGYVLVGFEENGSKVETFENRNYNLKAIWKNLDDVKILDASDIFSLEGDYYIVFIKNNVKKYDELRESILKCEYNKCVNVYIVDITNKKIARKYTGSDGEGYNNLSYFSKAKSIDEVYICTVPCLVKVNVNGENEYIATFINEVIKQLDNIK